MLPKTPRDVTEDLLLEVCRQHWPESQTLDFKRELPPVTPAGRQEFAKDLCALANADGGDLIYGIGEHMGGADALVPIQGVGADEVRRRLTQIADALLEPRVSGVAMQDVPLAAGGFVFVVRVPASLDSPHRFRLTNDHTKFVVRNGTLTSEMTYDQIRLAFDRTATLVERAHKFRLDRCEAVSSGRAWRPLAPGPLAAIHLLPLASFSGRSTVDVGALHDGNYATFSQTQPPWGAVTTRTLNLDGLVIHPGQDGAVLAYSQVFRSGCLETVRNMTHAHEGEGIIPSTVLAMFARHMTDALVRGARQNGFVGPALLGVSLLRVENVRLGLGQRYLQQIAEGADRRNLIAPETWISALDGVTEVDSIVRPILDIIWQCFGQPRCLEYDNEGRWNPQ